MTIIAWINANLDALMIISDILLVEVSILRFLVDWADWQHDWETWAE